MATIRGLMQDDLVIAEIQPNDKRRVILKFSRLLKSTGRIEHEDKLVRELLERESLGSTGLGCRVVALLHSKLHFSPKLIVACDKVSRGINFPTLDKKPAKFFQLIIAIINRENILESLAYI
jgi:mannitol/fructose-specific phosphotransferase system IIA component (Ntr-type)